MKLRIKASKKDIVLSLEDEEVATWWADAELTEFAAKDKVRENFWLCFKHAVAGHPEVNGLEDLDFTLIKEHLDKVREEKKNRPTEVKKQELIERAEKNAKYTYCMIDGLQEKVSNFMIEPPGIFRGRGEHPHAGKIKNRVVPEYVTINIGMNEVIPACPIPGHSWKRVINNTEASWLCHFKDEKNTYAGSGKYLALAAESRLKGLNDKRKYERARRLKACIEEIRKDYLKNMESKNREHQQLGLATYFIDKLALRVGNEKGEDEADTVGCCSLRVEHISLTEGENKVTFDFLGKDSMRYFNTVDVLPIVYQTMLKMVVKPDSSPKDPKDDLFEMIDSSKLNDYFKKFMKDLSAKVFRTYNASITLQTQLEAKAIEQKITADSQVEAKIKYYNDCNRDVAILCNHKKAEPKNLKD